jgi:hypothetical protein
MFIRLAIVTAMCIMMALATSSLAAADPESGPVPVTDDAAPLPPDGAVPSEAPSIYHAPDGWTLTVGASGETQLPVPPLTTAVSSREYLVGATFTGSVRGPGNSDVIGGTFEVGYQVGCTVTFDRIKLLGEAGIGASGSTLGGLVPTGVAFPIRGSMEVALKPGEVLNVPVDKKAFKGKDTQITVRNIHVKLDGCVGQSFLRSYAVLTSSTDTTDDIASYYGLTKIV